jgi:hypothetical protein
MACFRTKNPNLGKFWMGQWTILVYLMAIWSIFGHLVYFTTIRSIGYTLRLFGIFCGRLVYFPHFGMLYQEKSDNPAYEGHCLGCEIDLNPSY